MKVERGALGIVEADMGHTLCPVEARTKQGEGRMKMESQFNWGRTFFKWISYAKQLALTVSRKILLLTIFSTTEPRIQHSSWYSAYAGADSRIGRVWRITLLYDIV